MLDDKTKNQVKKLHSQWQEQANKSKTLNKKFITVSGEEINPLYTPMDLEGIDFERDINFPWCLSLHSWRSCQHVSGQAVDHAAIFRHGQCSANQWALSFSIEQGTGRCLPRNPSGRKDKWLFRIVILMGFGELLFIINALNNFAIIFSINIRDWKFV